MMMEICCKNLQMLLTLKTCSYHSSVLHWKQSAQEKKLLPRDPPGIKISNTVRKLDCGCSQIPSFLPCFHHCY
jgi:hypothetical protein